ncbi:MAG: S8 family serine peptidase [Firmicutes bacterium]|nr:S8 family serine peptidase [Bacillota bacterium]
MSRSCIWRRASLIGILVVILATFTASAKPNIPISFAISEDPFPVIPVSRGRADIEWADGEILVKLKGHKYVSEADVHAKAVGDAFHTLNTRLGVEVIESIAVSDVSEIHRIKLPETMSVEEAVLIYESSPFVEYAEPNYLWYPDVMPNDRFFLLGYMYNMHNIGLKAATERWFHVPLADADIDAPEAWDIRTDTEDVIVCVIDQGIQYYHPDLAPNMWINEAELYGEPGVDDDGNGFIDDIYGWDFFYDDNTIYHEDGEEDYHGTHCAGIIGARGNDAVEGGFHGGVAGVTWNVQIMSCKFLGPGGGYTSDAIKALDYAKMMGATLTSNSWGGGSYSKALEEAIANSGMLFIAAAGNEGTDNDIIPHYPSSYDLPNVIAVAATEWNDKPANFSNYGPNSVDIGAPGHMILSCYPDGSESLWAWMGGTSMATPHVAGAAALLIAEFPDFPHYPEGPGWTPGLETIKDILLKSGDPLPDLVGRTTSGRRLNIYNALSKKYPPGIKYAQADVTFGAPPLTVNLQAAIEDPSGVSNYWWQLGEDKVYGLSANLTLVEENSIVAWFYAEGIDGSISKLPVQVTTAEPGTIIYVDDTGGFDVGIPLNLLFFWAAEDAGIPYVRVNTRYPLGLSETAIENENPIFWDTGFTRYEVVSPFDQELLANFMDDGGRVFIAAPDYLGDMGLDWFGADYLHILGAYGLNVEIDIYKGVEGDPITDGISLEWQVMTKRDDLIAPDLVSRPIMTGAWDLTEDDDEDPVIVDLPGALGLRHANDTYRLVYLSAPWSSLMYAWDGYDPEDPDINTTPYLLTKIYEYLIGDINIPPAIDKTEASLYFAKPDQEIEFACQAHDPDTIENGEISYIWDFDDGTLAETAIARHAYTEPGEYRPTVWVEDAEGEFVGAELYVAVLNREDIVFVNDRHPNESNTSGFWVDLFDKLDKEYVEVRSADVVADSGAKAGLDQFRVIWTCAQYGGLDYAEQAAIADFLDKGGRLFLTGPEVLWELDPDESEFVRNYLHVIGKEDDVGTTFVTGVEGDPITDGLEIVFDDLDLVDGTDSLVLAEGAYPIFLNDTGEPCALRYEGEHRLAFLSFMFEAIPTASSEAARIKSNNDADPSLPPSIAKLLLDTIIDWLGLQPEVTVLAPASGDKWYGKNDVKWEAVHPDDVELTIALEYSFDDGATWTTLATGLVNNGVHKWDVSEIPRSGPCRVKVVASDRFGNSGQAISGEFLLINVVANSFIVGPVPASDVVNFYINAPDGATLYVYNMAGGLVFSHEIPAGQCFYQWPLVTNAGRPLANGLYLCYMETADGIKSDIMRLVISR